MKLPDIEKASPDELAKLSESNKAVADLLVEQTLQDLAKLSPMDYDRQREATAKTLGVRVATLDAEVESRRPVTAKPNGNGAAILLPDVEPWPSPVDGEALLDAICNLFIRYLILPCGAAVALALWVIHTYTFDTADCSPYLLITSAEKRSAKTLVLEILSAIVRKALAASNVTASVLFRTIERFEPTLLIDEADSFVLANEELRGVLNSGHRRGTAFVLRSVGDDHEPKRFSTWCPKAIAAIGKLPDTIEDRSIRISMKRKGRGEKVQRMRYRNLEAEAADLKRQATRWAADHMEALRLADPPAPEALNDRAADCWRPLLAIADRAGGAWPERARQSALQLSGSTVDDSIGVQLLSDIQDIFVQSATDKVASETIVEELAKLEGRPWGEWGKSQKPMSKNQLARVLHRYEIQTKKVRLGSKTAQGYDLEQFSDAFSRYLTLQTGTPEQPTTDAGFSDFQNGTQREPVPDKNNAISNKIKECSDVPVQKPEIRREVRI